MEHDKLIDLIGNPWDDGFKYADIVFNKALRAVVELHKPYGIDEWPNIKSYCEHCEHLQSEIWPCKTIQAIEKELE